MALSRSSGRIATPVALSLLAIAVGFGTYQISLRSNVSDSIPVVVLNVDLERALSWAPPETLKFPPRRLELTCYLPESSPMGEYRVFVDAEDRTHSIEVGRFAANQGRLGRAIQIKLDLRYTSRGTYFLELIPPQGNTLRYPFRVLA